MRVESLFGVVDDVYEVVAVVDADDELAQGGEADES